MPSLWVPGKPKVKGRPRFTKSGRTYTPKETVEAEAALAAAWAEADLPLVDGPVYVYMRFEKERTGIDVSPAETFERKPVLRGDIDNYVKLVLDGLQGVAFGNDRCVVALEAEKD